ncbi:hypothetical protein LMG19087_01785 [Ralstonia wenshanensis]|jgi:hypothetical protein|uniref:hypothetical protein n=1 Tax=Ralstonia wenshanensis TaxID=2842456 RepID=UPI0028F6BF14|nr:hypothetical protein [Ralstonia wenshanensis]CAJ0813502.1 hypothetical protein LMG19087_01785 [Ralstonia wenshanensis]
MTMIDGASIGYWKAHAPAPETTAALNTLRTFNASHPLNGGPSQVLTTANLLATKTSEPDAGKAMDTVNRERQQVSAAEDACRTLVAQARAGKLDTDMLREVHSQTKQFQDVVNAEAKSGGDALKTMVHDRINGEPADFLANFSVESQRATEVQSIVGAQNSSPYTVMDTDSYANHTVAPLLDQTRQDMQAVAQYLPGTPEKNAALINLTHDLDVLKQTRQTLEQDGAAAGNMQNLGGALQTQATQHMTWGFNQLNQLEPLMRDAVQVQRQGVIDVAITRTPNLADLHDNALAAVNDVEAAHKSVMDPSNAVTSVQRVLGDVIDPTTGKAMLQADIYSSNGLEALISDPSLRWSR